MRRRWLRELFVVRRLRGGRSRRHVPAVHRRAEGNRGHQPRIQGAVPSLVLDERTARREQRPKHGAVAPGFIEAVAPDGDFRLMRQGRQEIQQSDRGRTLHLRSVAPYEGLPRLRVLRLQRDFHQRLGRREIGQPDVIEVTRRVLAPRYATRRPANGAQTDALVTTARAAELNDLDWHSSLNPCRPRHLVTRQTPSVNF